MELRDYQKRIYTNLKPHENQKDEIFDYMIGITEEAGEVASIIKHHYYGGEELNKVELAKEITDILWYSAAMLAALNINLDVAATINVRKLEHRFANGFSKEASQARHENEKKFSETDEYKQLVSELKLGE